MPMECLGGPLDGELYEVADKFAAAEIGLLPFDGVWQVCEAYPTRLACYIVSDDRQSLFFESMRRY